MILNGCWCARRRLSPEHFALPVMPLAARLLAKLFQMPPDLAAGMILVGSVASGTASNVMIYLAKGDVALSVTISSVSALVGVFATPLLTRLYVDTHVEVDVVGMLLSIVKIVAIPIALGLLVHHTLNRPVKRVEPRLPAFSMVCILLIISAVVAGSQSFIGSVGPVAIAAVVMHNAIGLLGGYWGGKLFGFDESTCRTLALEVGMQNSGLAATLGKLYFRHWRRCPARCFPSGTTFPARCWQATGPANRSNVSKTLCQPRRLACFYSSSRSSSGCSSTLYATAQNSELSRFISPSRPKCSELVSMLCTFF